jgi:hypothetical protein
MAAVLLALAALACIHSPRLNDDSFAHFTESVAVVRAGDWTRALTDSWNKPATVVVYGFAGLVGLSAARLASLLLCVLAAILTAETARRWRWVSGSMAWVCGVVALLFQPALLSQAILTMTEQLAAFLLALGLWLQSGRRFRSAALVWGCVPLARMEAGLVMGMLLVASAWRFPDASDRVRSPWRVTVWLWALGLLPCLAWYVAGVWLTGRLQWPMASYCYPRSFSAIDLVCVNGFTGLAGALSSPQLLLLFCGLGACFLQARGDAVDAWRLRLVLGALMAHLLFLSVFVVYGAGTGFGGLAIGAVNNRAYNTIAPLTALLILRGMSVLVGRGADERTRPLLVSAGTAALAVSAYAVFQWRLPAFFGWPSIALQWTVQTTLLAAACWILWRSSRERSGTAAAVWLPAVAVCLVAGPLVTPFFWYPLRFSDQRVCAQGAFRDWLAKAGAADPPAVIVQDLAASFDAGYGRGRIPVEWCYPALMQQTLADAPGGSILLVETDPELNWRERYPAGLRDLAENSGTFLRCAEYRGIGGVSVLDTWLSRLTPRNAPMGWLAYRKRRTPAAVSRSGREE